jgi:hypothetical protein
MAKAEEEELHSMLGEKFWGAVMACRRRVRNFGSV